MVSASVLLHPTNRLLVVNEVGTRESPSGEGSRRTCATDDRHRSGRAAVRHLAGDGTGQRPALALYRKLGGEEQAIAGFGWDDAL